MHNDQMIMGVCGETRIANKRQSWVTAIQVFEYFISHHMAKAFESVFGGVSCLPGCFSMFRLKARKFTGDDWIPLIIKPEIVKEYSQSDVVTLHQKNLLLLGEDRFLTTILIRTFPNRKMMFLPQAKCRTVVPTRSRCSFHNAVVGSTQPSTTSWNSSSSGTFAVLSASACNSSCLWTFSEPSSCPSPSF
jgi:cellulose synthase/poly-beta-1,6-N-acetylglucosamine synthase-like glycosyltransferase